MNLTQRINLAVKLGEYMVIKHDYWQEIKEKAFLQNPWFQPEFIDLALKNITERFLKKDILQNWIAQYPGIKENKENPKWIGLVMAGNLPLVGFHDFLTVFISGNKCLIKPSSKDEVLIKHLVEKLIEWEPSLANEIQFSEMLKGCDAYIATGSNNSASHFKYYFGKYPSIIRQNRTSVAILTGQESDEELSALADDVFLYFGLGCRNVTKIYVPEGYNFETLLSVFSKYKYFSDIHKYKNNYDYNLALHILNNKFYMTNGVVILIEDNHLFSPVSQLNYEFYKDADQLNRQLMDSNDLQCVVGKDYIPFGQAQCPLIDEYADGVNTMQFLEKL